MRRPAAIALLSFALLGLTGCKGACRELSERVCECSTTTSLEREVCVRRAANDETIVEPTAEDETFCESKLSSCNCVDNPKFDINSTTGKEACGLAHETSGPAQSRPMPW
jgi:hypothetical protein